MGRLGGTGSSLWHDYSVPPEQAGHQLVCRGLERGKKWIIFLSPEYVSVCVSVLLSPYAAAGGLQEHTACRAQEEIYLSIYTYIYLSICVSVYKLLTISKTPKTTEQQCSISYMCNLLNEPIKVQDHYWFQSSASGPGLNPALWSPSKKAGLTVTGPNEQKCAVLNIYLVVFNWLLPLNISQFTMWQSAAHSDLQVQHQFKCAQYLLFYSSSDKICMCDFTWWPRYKKATLLPQEIKDKSLQPF